MSTNRGLWEAIRATFPFWEPSILVLPDTIFQIVDPIVPAPLSFGVFETNESHRYSILVGDSIVTKPEDVITPQLAWGCVSWTPDTIDFWSDKKYAHYDDAFNAAMHVFGYKTFKIEDYQDLGDWESYRNFILRGNT